MELRKETNLYNDDAIQNGMDTVATQKAQQAVSALDQEAVFNKLTNNGSAQGIFLRNGQLYINMTYLQSGTLRLGGYNNINGSMTAYNADNNLIGKFDKDGILINGYRMSSPYDMWKYMTINESEIRFYTLQGTTYVNSGVITNTDPAQLRIYSEDALGQIYIGVSGSSRGDHVVSDVVIGAKNLLSIGASSDSGLIKIEAGNVNIRSTKSDGDVEIRTSKNRNIYFYPGSSIEGWGKVIGIDNHTVVFSDRASNSSSENSRIKLIFHYPPSPESIGFLRYDGTLRYVSCSTSDEKLKWNIKPTTVEALDVLDAIKYYSFDYKNGGHHDIGYIAQELEKHIPTAVFDVPQFDEKGAKTDTIKQLNDHEIIVYATKAIQELYRKVIELETRINNM